MDAAASSSLQCDVDAADVVKVVLQFLKENSLTASLQALQDESQVALNTVENLDGLVADVQQGRWDAVMSTIATLKLSPKLLEELYEQLVLEMIELRELDTAKQLLRGAEPMAALRASKPERHAALEALASRPYFDPAAAYPDGSSKERRRTRIAESLKAEVSVVPPNRLLALLGQALKWQQQQGLLPAGAKFDLLRGGAAQRIVEKEDRVTAPGPTIKFGKKSHAECAAFSPDGQFFVSGSVDGFLEVWDFERGKVRKDLSYQESDEYMMHDEVCGRRRRRIANSPPPPLQPLSAAPPLHRRSLRSTSRVTRSCSCRRRREARSKCGACGRGSACGASRRRTARASRASRSRATPPRWRAAPSTRSCGFTASRAAKRSKR